MIKYYDFLIEEYTEYITKITTDTMAASLETTSFLLELCKDVNSVIDFGSGFLRMLYVNLEIPMQKVLM